MWPVSNKILKLSVTILFILLTVSSQGQQLVYDLKQEWVNYDSESKGFLPVNDKDYELNTIGFSLDNPGIDQFYLSIYVNSQAYLFYGADLITTLPRGTTNLKIDSLKNVLSDASPFFTIYGNGLMPSLKTEIRSDYHVFQETMAVTPIYYSGDFTNFFYIAATLLILFFVILRTRFADLAEQYLLVDRAIRGKTIDELIYKIEYIAFPNAYFLMLISMTLSLTAISFMYYFPGEMTILGIKPGVASLTGLFLSWGKLAAVIFILLVIKYLFTRFLSNVFDLKISNIHYASSLRLILMITIIVFLITVVQFFFVGVLTPVFFWLVVLVSIVIMIQIIFFKLSLVTSHTLLYIIVYLCATEILPTVFLLKFFTT